MNMLVDYLQSLKNTGTPKAMAHGRKVLAMNKGGQTFEEFKEVCIPFAIQYNEEQGAWTLRHIEDYERLAEVIFTDAYSLSKAPTSQRVRDNKVQQVLRMCQEHFNSG